MKAHILLLPALCTLLFAACSQPSVSVKNQPAAAQVQPGSPETLRQAEIPVVKMKRGTSRILPAPGPAELFSKKDLSPEYFFLSPDADTLLKGKNGTTLHIRPGSFETMKGEKISGPIRIELAEALTAEDLVLAGLPTLADGKLLESGGTIYVGASCSDEPLRLKHGRSITAGIPKKRSWERMKLWEGRETTSGINWVSPQELKKKQKPVQRSRDIEREKDSLKIQKILENQQLEVGYKTKAAKKILWVVKGDTLVFDKARYQKFWSGADLSEAMWNFGQRSFFHWFYDAQDTSSQLHPGWKTDDYIDYEIDFTFSSWSVGANRNGLYGADFSKGGINLYQTDTATTGIFEMKKLGWANIDRLAADKRTQEIELKTVVDNHADFGKLYISLVLKAEQIYLPGYQKKDKTFCFSHDDFESTRLPVGAEGWIVVTAYEKDKVYFDMQPITISKKQEIHLKPIETTKEAMQEKIRTNL